MRIAEGVHSDDRQFASVFEHFVVHGFILNLAALVTGFHCAQHAATVGNGVMVALEAKDKDQVHRLYDIALANGGTGSTTKSGARTNLGISVGTTAPASPAVGDLWVDTN